MKIWSDQSLANGCDPDGWPPVALKESAVEISSPLSIILSSHFNLMFYLTVEN